MNIALIITDYGSFNNFLGELAMRLVSAGHKVNVICSDKRIINIEDKFPYKNFGIRFEFVSFPRGFNILKHYRTSIRIHKLLNNLSPDIVHVHFTTGIFTTTLTGKPRFPTIGTFHGLGFPVIDNFFKKNIFKLTEFLCFQRLDQIWVLNEYDRALLARTPYAYKSKMLETKGLGCNLSKFDDALFSSAYKSELRSQLHIRPNDFVITFTGRFVSFKGFDTLVKAFRYLLQNSGNRNFKLLLIGGHDEIHPTGLSIEEETWMEQCSDITNVGFTTEVEKYLSISNCFAFPSLKEGMPVCIIEALAMGVPVITADTRGCSDLISNNYNGILLSKRPAVLEVANAILRLANEPQLCEKLKVNIAIERGLLDRKNFVEHEVTLYTNFNLD